MEKSAFNQNYIFFLTLLKRTRQVAGLTQTQVAERLGLTQSFISKCERGERRLDVIELRAFCQAIGVPIADFISQLEKMLEGTEN